MRAVKLSIANIVTLLLKPQKYPPATGTNRQNIIKRAVRNKNGWFSIHFHYIKKSGEKAMM